MKQYNIVLSEFEIRIVANLIEEERTKEDRNRGVTEVIGEEVLQAIVDKITPLIGSDITIRISEGKS